MQKGSSQVNCFLRKQTTNTSRIHIFHNILFTNDTIKLLNMQRISKTVIYSLHFSYFLFKQTYYLLKDVCYISFTMSRLKFNLQTVLLKSCSIIQLHWNTCSKFVFYLFSLLFFQSKKVHNMFYTVKSIISIIYWHMFLESYYKNMVRLLVLKIYY